MKRLYLRTNQVNQDKAVLLRNEVGYIISLKYHFGEKHQKLTDNKNVN